MAQLDVNAYATTAANAAAGAPSVIETQQPGGTGSLRQVVTLGDAVTRANMQTIKAASTAATATDLPAVVALHPSSPLPTGANPLGKVVIDQTTNIIAATTMQNAAVALAVGTNLNVQGYASAIISITGTMSAGTTITFKESPDDVAFLPITAHQLGVAGNLSTTTTTIGEYRVSCAGLKSLQAVITTYGAGTVTVKGTVSVLAGHPTTVNANLIAALPTGDNTVGRFKLTDGTQTLTPTTESNTFADAKVGISVLARTAGTGAAAIARPLLVDANGNLLTASKITGSVVSTVNSTAVALAAAGVFTGTSEDITQYSSVSVQLISNVASATDGLSMQQSPDGTNWDNIDAYSIPAATGKNFGVHVSANFFRVVYTNGATLQTSFRLQTIYHVIATATSSVRPQDARGNDNDMQEVIAYGAVYNGTTWDRARGDTTAGSWVQLKAAIPAGTAIIGALVANQSVNTTQLAGVAVATGNGTQAAGTQRVTLASDSTGQITVASKTTGGATNHTLISAATTNATLVKNTPATVFGVQASNTGAAVAFLKLFNLTVAPTVGTSVAVKTLIIPAGGGIVLPANDIGAAFSTGLSYSITALATTADLTAVALSQVVVNIDYA